MLKRSTFCPSRRIKSVSTASTARLQNAKSKWSFSCSDRRSRPLSGCRKKYKRAKKAANWSAVGSSMFSTVLSSASLGSALSVVGIPAAIPLGGVGGAFALASSGLIIASKKLDSKIKKHQEIVTLAIAKRDTVLRLHSKALADNKITDSEFQLIMAAEFSQYNVPVKSKLQHPPPRATPRAFEFLENFCSNSPLPRPKSCSNAPSQVHSRWSNAPTPGKLFGSFYYAPAAVYVNMV